MLKRFMILMTWSMVGLVPQASQVQAAGLQIHTKENKPLNYTAPNGELRGVVVEIVKEIQKRVGDSSPIHPAETWEAAYDETLKQPGHMLFSTARTSEREKLFKWVGPLTQVKACLYSDPAKGLAVGSLEEARKLKKIAAAKKFFYTQFLLDNKFTNVALYDSPKEAFEAFLSGGADAFAGQNLTVSYLLTDSHAPAGKVKVLYNLMPPKKHYLAFNAKTPDEVIAKWQKALDDMKADGAFKELFVKYRISPDVMP
jgi:polar amino acid transport system substrate-binding protein